MGKNLAFKGKICIGKIKKMLEVQKLLRYLQNGIYVRIIVGSFRLLLIPWSEFEEKYAEIFSEDMGAPALAI